MPENEQYQSVVGVSDEPVIRMWLHGRPPNTAGAYRRDIEAFRRALSGAPLVSASLANLHAYANAASGSPVTVNRRLSAIRSFYRFAHQVGIITVNPAASLRVERPAESGAERILTETQVNRMIAAARTDRDRHLLRLLYACGLRASELCGLRWRDVTRGAKGSAEARIVGKGSKPRVVTIPAAVLRDLVAASSSQSGDAPVITGDDGRAVTRQVVWRAVRAAARRAGLDQAVSPHWLRHAHASHALDHGAPLQTVQRDLGHASAATTSRYLHKRPGDSSSEYLAGLR